MKKSDTVVLEFNTGLIVIGTLVKEDQYTISIHDPYEVDTMKPFTFYAESDIIDFQRNSLLTIYTARDIAKRLYDTKREQYIKAGGRSLVDQVIEQVINLAIETHRAEDGKTTLADMFAGVKKDPNIKLN